MTNKEAFDIVSAHLRSMYKQSKECAVSPTKCAYRAKDGGKCAVGVLIPDSEYKPKFESDEYSLTRVLSECQSLAGLSIYLLRDLQTLHDSSKYWDSTGLNMEGKNRLDEIQIRLYNTTL